MDILQAIHDENLFRSYMAGTPDGSLDSWANWLTFLRTLYGLHTEENEHDVIRQCTGRAPEKLCPDGYSECLVLAGRRSGKSKTIALVGVAEALLSGKQEGLSAGEIPLVAVISPTRFQSRIIFSYMRGVFDSSPLLQNEVVEEKRDGFVLRNGVEISVVTGDPKKVRGFTLISCTIDEAPMFGFSEEAKINDTELVRAIRPALITASGTLLLVGTPYAAQGHCYQTWKRHFGNDASDVLVWNAATLLMNPTLNPAIIRRAVEEDPTAANVEYCTSPGLFREDVDPYVSRAVVESLVIRGRKELAPQSDLRYVAFADVSGGRHDDAAICVAHKEDRVVIIDCLERFKSPHNPFEVVAAMSRTLQRYSLDRVTGDAYSAEWSKQTFKTHGVDYRRSSKSAYKTGAGSWKAATAKPKSTLYAELLPRLHSAEIELLDDETLITQLSLLQRRTRSGGRDQIDHPPGGKDDLANVVAGAAVLASERGPLVIKPMFSKGSDKNSGLIAGLLGGPHYHGPELVVEIDKPRGIEDTGTSQSIKAMLQVQRELSESVISSYLAGPYGPQASRR